MRAAQGAQAGQAGTQESSDTQSGNHVTAETPGVVVGMAVCDAVGDMAPPSSPWRSPWGRLKGRLGMAVKGARVVPVEDDFGSVELGDYSTRSTAPASPVKDVCAPKSGDVLQSGKKKAAETRSQTCFGRLLHMYCEALDKRPILTKSFSSGVIGLLGDLTAQIIEWCFGGAAIPWNSTHAIWRSCAVMIDGFFINGPLLHYLYGMLEECMPAGESLLASAMQVCVDVFVIDPVFAFIFIWSTGLIEGRSIDHEILDTLKNEYPTMVVWLVVIGLAWAPLQIYLFNRYPVEFRVLVADLIDLVWTCVTSFFCHV